MSKLRVAVVGPGRIAHSHLLALKAANDAAEIVAIVGLPVEEEVTKRVAAEFGAARTYSSYEAALADRQVDAVVLTVPNHVHAPMATAAATAGKHVLIEKPLANTTAEADQMIESAQRAGTILMVGQCRRYFRAIEEARRLMPAIGRPASLVHSLGVYWNDVQAPWWRSAEKTGGLVIGLNGPHVVDTALLLLGQPSSVIARGIRAKQCWEGEDEATILINFDDGSMATLHLSFNSQPNVNERWINGPNGSLHIVDDRILYRDGKLVVEEPSQDYLVGDISFERQMREFVSACLEKRQPRASAQEVRAVVEILEAARMSMVEQSIVPLRRSLATSSS